MVQDWSVIMFSEWWWIWHCWEVCYNWQILLNKIFGVFLKTIAEKDNTYVHRHKPVQNKKKKQRYWIPQQCPAAQRSPQSFLFLSAFCSLSSPFVQPEHCEPAVSVKPTRLSGPATSYRRWKWFRLISWRSTSLLSRQFRYLNSHLFSASDLLHFSWFLRTNSCSDAESRRRHYRLRFIPYTARVWSSTTERTKTIGKSINQSIMHVLNWFKIILEASFVMNFATGSARTPQRAQQNIFLGVGKLSAVEPIRGIMPGRNSSDQKNNGARYSES